MNFNLGREGYTPGARCSSSTSRSAARIAGLPGVQARGSRAECCRSPAASCAACSPRATDTTTRDRILVQVNSVGAGYFETIGIPLLTGRDFASTDTARLRSSSSINETMAERFWPGDDADRQALQVLRRRRVHDGGRRGAQQQVQRGRRRIRSRSSTSRCCRTTRRRPRCTCARPATPPVSPRPSGTRVQQIDPTLSVFNIRTLEDQVFESLAPLRTNVVILALIRRAGAAPRVDRPLRRRDLLRDAAYARDRRAHGARRTSRLGAAPRPRPRPDARRHRGRRRHGGRRRVDGVGAPGAGAERQRSRPADVRRHGGALERDRACSRARSRRFARRGSIRSSR